jgi:hypothetical protein
MMTNPSPTPASTPRRRAERDATLIAIGQYGDAELAAWCPPGALRRTIERDASLAVTKAHRALIAAIDAEVSAARSEGLEEAARVVERWTIAIGINAMTIADAIRDKATIQPKSTND